VELPIVYNGSCKGRVNRALPLVEAEVPTTVIVALEVVGNKLWVLDSTIQDED
jgi:hypothetical protein